MRKSFLKQSTYIEKHLDKKGRKYFTQIVYFIDTLLKILEAHGVKQENFTEEIDKLRKIRCNKNGD